MHSMKMRTVEGANVKPNIAANGEELAWMDLALKDVTWIMCVSWDISSENI